MKERTRKILIIIGLVISCVYVVYQFIFFFEEGPSGDGLLPLLLIAILISLILLSRKYIEEFFKSRQLLTILLAFMILALIIDNFYEIAFQIGMPMHPILWIDLMIRFVFFIRFILLLYRVLLLNIFLYGCLLMKLTGLLFIFHFMVIYP